MKVLLGAVVFVLGVLALVLLSLVAIAVVVVVAGMLVLRVVVDWDAVNKSLAAEEGLE